MSYAYQTYGLRLKSDWPLPCLEQSGSALVEVELVEATSGCLSEASLRGAESQSDGDDWFRHLRLSDGSEYLQWSGLFEFLVSTDGRRIACRELNGSSYESFHTYLLGQVLSFAMLKHGIESLHSTAVVIHGEAVAFLGDCGYGKSSLGAAFLKGGCRLLTDDLLALKDGGDRFVAYPGPPRIKLFPGIARRLLGERVTSTPMNNFSPKLVIPLQRNETVLPQDTPPLRAIYVLTPPRASSRSPRITIRPLSHRRAFIELIKNTFNTVIVDSERLKRQFVLATRLAARVPVKSLSYPRKLAQLPAVREAIRSDLNNGPPFSFH